MLTELTPIPKPKVHRWGCEELFPQFTARDEFYRAIKPRRIELLRGLIGEYKPMVFVGYGKAFWKDYRKLFEGCEFKQDGQFQTSIYQAAQVILAGH